MSDEIKASAGYVKALIDSERMPVSLNALIGKYATAQIYHAPARTLEQMRRALVHELAKKWLPNARKVGKQAATPILSRLGRDRLDPASYTSRHRTVSWLSKYTRDNLDVLNTEIEATFGELSHDIKIAMAKAKRDGVKRAQLIADMVEADKAELARLQKVRREIAQADKRILKARGAKQIKAAEKLRKIAKVKLKTGKSALARLETKIQGQARDAVRRESQRAQMAEFEKAGATTYEWLAVGGTDACPQCKALHGQTGTKRDWSGRMPGDGHTYCGSSCICQLVPAEYNTDKHVDKPISLVG